jgi:hypothetical protein
VLESSLVRGAHRYEIDFDHLRARLEPDARLILLCNPHNPTGRVFEREELLALGELALEHDLVVVSDEIHADLAFPGHGTFLPHWVELLDAPSRSPRPPSRSTGRPALRLRHLRRPGAAAVPGAPRRVLSHRHPRRRGDLRLDGGAAVARGFSPICSRTATWRWTSSRAYAGYRGAAT